MWLVPEAQYFITSSKHNLISRSTWGLVWQYLDVHHHYYKWANLIRYEASIHKLISIHSFIVIESIYHSSLQPW